ncbi:asparagine synthase-related protein [Streptomyces sp. A1499]|uniref:asparagine synthase-related protein n=1 Tax=Streptomyces sp. A1499 TaxID=2563104 RepID=UPI00109EE272|nr:asparagine synthase-related protein [Streptomyces sp. A1499]THC45156.1 asparagine synthase [Streptomyces sp. A1499]
MEFIVLPDHPAADAVLALSPHRTGDKVVRHPSGRPWVIGSWRDEELTAASAGSNAVVLLGRTRIGETELARKLAAMRSVNDMDSLSRSTHGCFHLLASIGGQVRAQGSLTTVCQVFYGSVAGVAVAADRPQSVAALTGGAIDEELVALRLLSPTAPHPLSQACLWRGVTALPLGHYLLMPANSDARPVRWWTPPEPSVPLAQGADTLRRALEAAVETRTAHSATVSTDLSGGMDSTSLCFLAAPRAARLVTYHHVPLDPSNDDGIWAGRCAADLPDARHVKEHSGTAPAWYAGCLSTDEDVEGPFPLIRTRAKLEHLARTMAALGSTAHLQGIGGDELFHARAACAHALARAHPLRSARQVRVVRSMSRWTTSATIGYLLSGGTYARWLRSSAALLGPEPRKRTTGPAWESPPAMPVWATPRAVDAVRSLIRAAADGEPEPLAPLPVQHDMLSVAQLCGEMTRRASRFTARHGVSYEAPYLDDRVVEAAMSVRLEDRIAAGRYKPVLATAMRDVLPAYAQGRATKGDYSGELYSGLRQHRADLLELCEESVLVGMGLVDRVALRGLLLGLHPDTSPFMAFDSTLACELWLRSLYRDNRSGTTASLSPNREET